MKTPLRARLGRALYHAWHRPAGALLDCMREGGPLEQRRTARGRGEMEAAAARLPGLPETGGAEVALHVLTGRRFWYQTAFCLWSFARHAGRPVAPVIYDDGTLDAQVREPLARLFSRARFVEQGDTLERLE